MIRTTLFAALVLTPIFPMAAEKVAGQDVFQMNEQSVPVSPGVVFWSMQNRGETTITEGPLAVASVECHGSGFWKAGDQRGEGVCIYGEGADTFVQVWKIEPFGEATWRIASASGKFAGLTGRGKSASRTEGGRRVSDWVGEVEMP